MALGARWITVDHFPGSSNSQVTTPHLNVSFTMKGTFGFDLLYVACYESYWIKSPQYGPPR